MSLFDRTPRRDRMAKWAIRIPLVIVGAVMYYLLAWSSIGGPRGLVWLQPVGVHLVFLLFGIAAWGLEYHDRKSEGK